MNRLLQAAHQFVVFCDTEGWHTCLIGGLAVQRWGEPRTTLYADFTLLVGWQAEAAFVDALLGRFVRRIPDARLFALQHRVLLLKADNGVDLDVSMGALPFEQAMIQRSQRLDFGDGVVLPVCSPEDLVVLKAFAGRPRDWGDVQSVLDRTSGLDRSRIQRDLAELCELAGDTSALGTLVAMMGRTR